MDQVVLFPPGGSPPAPSFIPLGSWLMGDPGPDFGAKGLIQSLESSNALTDGGRFSFRYAPPRKMSLPLILNPMYGVNRLTNPGFETGSLGSFINVHAGTFTVVPNASGGVGSYFALGSVSGGSTMALGLVITPGGIPASEPMLIGALACDLTPSNPNENVRMSVRMLVNPGAGAFFIQPSSPAPGYVGALDEDLANGVWTRVGGIWNAQQMGSILAMASQIRLEWFLDFPSAGGASANVLALDELEFRSAYQPRAVREWEGQLREYSTPGAYISVQPEGVPSQEAVFFDVLDGRWEPDYNIYENRAGVRKGTLYLDTQPFGYWPTEILLASSASVGWMGQLPVNGASIIGDVPPLAHVIINPTVASFYTGNFAVDMVALSFAGRPSFYPFLSGGSFFNWAGAGSVMGDKYAPASQAMILTANAPGSWIGPNYYAIPSSLEPAFRGRFRAFLFAKSTPSWGQPAYAVVDVARGARQQDLPIASSNTLASVYSAIPSGVFIGVPTSYCGSPQYGMYDMGELTLPPFASGVQGQVTLRLWLQMPASSATTQVLNGGIYLLPVDGAAGILTRGLNTPSLNLGGQGGLEMNAQFVDSVLVNDLEPGTSSQLSMDGRAYYRGLTPRLGASTVSLLYVTGDRSAGNAYAATYPIANANVEYAQVSVSYRPTFQFLVGI